MPDFSLKVTADTKDAEVKLRQVDETADKATRSRSIKINFDSISGGVTRVASTFDNLDTKLADAANNVRKFYSVAEKVPVLGKPLAEFHQLIDTTTQAAQSVSQFGDTVRENSGASTILTSSFRISVVAAQDLISRLARLGMALFAVKEAAGMLQAAFGGMFSATVGREIAFRETVLKMQTTLASSQQKISVGGQELTDPYERVLAVQGAIEKRIESIRDRSLELAGVTSEQVVETFGIIVSQAGQIGVSLKQAEDLAISFAGALGTFGIPLEMARQEIQSIFMGSITSDSYLAKALNITNADIAKAKNQIGGVYGYLQEKLAAAVAGQKIAATSFAGVASNILEIAQAVQKAFGKSLLDPLLQGLTAAYNLIFGLRNELAGLAASVGTVLVSLLKVNFSKLYVGTADPTEGIRAGLIQLTELVGRIGQGIQAAITPVLGQIKVLIDAAGASIMAIVPGLAALAQGFLSLQAANLTALISAFTALSPLIITLTQTFSTLLTAYGSILQVPMVQYLSGIIVQWQVLGKTGAWAVMALASLGTFLIGSWSGVVKFFASLFLSLAAGFAKVTAGAATFVQQGTVMFAGLIDSAQALLRAFTTAFTGLATQVGLAGAAIRNFGVSMRAAQTSMDTSASAANRMAREGADMANNLRNVGQNAVTASTGVSSLGGNIANSIWQFAKANLALIAFQLVLVAAIDAWGKYDRAQKAAATNAEASSILSKYGDSLYKTSEELDKATQRQKEFNKAIVEGEYNAALQRIRDYKREVAEFQKRNEIAEGMGPVWGAVEKSMMVPQAMDLAQRQPGIRDDENLVARIDGAKQLADIEADLAAEAAKTKQQLQDQLALSQSLIERTQTLANTEIQRQVLNGKITADEAQLNTLYAERSATYEKLVTFMQALKDQTANGKFDAKELDKLKSEIAGLEGKRVEIEIRLNKTQFDMDVKQVDRQLTASTNVIALQSNAIQGAVSITQARAAAEQAVNSAALQGLQAQMQRAKSDSERAAIASQIQGREVANAGVALRSAVEQINANIALVSLARDKAVLEENALRVKIKIAQFHKQDVTLLLDALAAQKQGLAIAQQNLTTAINVGAEQKRGAQATYSGAVNAARLNYETNSAAKAAGAYASNMERGANAASSAASSVQSIASGMRISPGSLQGGDMLDQLQLKEFMKDQSTRRYASDPYGDFIKRQMDLMNFIGDKNKADYQEKLKSAVKGALDGIKAAQEKGDFDEARRLRSKLRSREASGMAAQLHAEDVRMQFHQERKQRQQFLDEESKLKQYTVEFKRPQSGDTAPGKGSPEGATNINITTGAVYKWQDKEFVSFDDMQKAIKDATEQLKQQIRGSSGTRQELGMMY